MRFLAPLVGLVTLSLTVTSVAIAEEEGADGAEAGAESAETSYPEISGDVSLGALNASGNTESESVNFQTEVGVDFAVWRHTVGASAYQASEDGVDTAERYTASLQSDYKFSERSYLFASVNYATDRFGPFDRRAAAAVGVGRRFIDDETMRLAAQIGVGRRILEPDGTNDRNREDIVRLSGDFAWAFAETSEFTQALAVESGDSNTYTESVTAVKSQINGALALKLSHTIEHNSDVPAGTEKTDRITAVSLEYGF